ncbi:putative MINDY deubiquitinase [Helianthus annuus]|uniref:MINDY deubiquitinase n=1 Tax=Helianthus annuus TaxID=4232 RepID=A0A9K3NES5_HELAN|nr:ubiquitin carboxyl-terminal hydrolase MINDY-1 isoform X3 [Helianthus annuus]KAF5797526.1 putative MINDY deubiquitinase [Helianthus annuus]KAJ0549262.1 putative MINDY deubiquitinase [Helianthus annuus]KAJ0562216.1 putative MINDY deubiquitinase [Helianthus annuus]KAJ0727590.1 putative MINDY deubiquitinase [Helianthus annuus]KAJ0730387.1 putative MINDY deubiquitinase [Helianthus annuus]
MSSPPEELPDPPATKEMLHKTKLIQFLGRNTPIILQNDNGPCPLLAICNVLLLRNNLNLSADVAEVSQEKLLSLVAERLIDSNSNVNNKDVGYIENQQQNISDAIDLLPRLTTGIDVNLKFTRISDFEFTRECAIFDLLDIPLYHGWIVDPQDSETAEAIGLKSYNTLMGELVALDTQNPQSEVKNPNPEEDFVDFAAATTASLGVPSPSLSTTKSFDEKKERKGDLEEEEELLRALKLSETENDVAVNTSKNNPSENSNDPSLEEKQKPENDDGLTFQTDRVQHVSSPLQDKLHDQNEGASEKHDTLIKSEKDTDGQDESDLAPPVNTNVDNSSVKKKIHDEEKIDFALTVNTNVDNSSVEKIHDQEKSDLAPPVNTHVDNPPIEKIQDQSVEGNVVNLESSKDLMQSNDESESKCLTESGDGSEPIYEGEEHIQETSTANYENREPVYEGEVVLAGQVDKVSSNADEVKGKDGITPKQGELIRNFLKNSANQLTIYGLFSLQDGLKERELCVFFRNNHFNTMFKFEGELYLLATDQGYINQPDLVWEKLNEVNGDTVYMTGSFKEFNAENPEPRSWDEQNALATTADYIASIDNAAQENTSFNSDLQLAIALQQQEFDQQQQQQQQQQTQHKLPQSSAVGQSGLVTGPQHVQPSRPRNSSSSKQESKSSKDKCCVM